MAEKKRKISIVSDAETVKRFFAADTIKRILLAAAAIVLLAFVLVSIPVWRIGKETIPATTSRAPAEGEEIAIGTGKVVVAENGGKTLSIDTATMVVTVTDETGYTFSSAANGTSGSELALVSLTYLGEDNNLYEWNSYDYSVAFETYHIYQIEDGVRIDINLNEGESNRFYEYLPKKMSIETYEEQFVGTLEQLMESGGLEEDTGNRYLTTLGLVYKKSLTEECYSVTYTGNPPVSATNQLIEVTKLVGYTTEQLLEDAETFDFSVTFTEPAQFDLVVELTLDEDGDLVAHMPTGSIVSYNDYYVAQNVSLLPNFGAVTADEYEDGYVLVPDGSGALMAFNSYIANVPDYKRPFYDSDYFSDYYYMPEYGEELYMPLFGMIYGGGESRTDKGFLAIVEESARTAYMNVKLASQDADSSKYNKAYASFEITQYNKVKIYGEYSTETGTYLVDTGMQDLDLTVRYLFYGADVTYFDMAKSYQAYLEETLGLAASYDGGEASLYLEVVGGLNITSRFVGIPYSSAYSMTTYEELLEMMDGLEGVNYQLQYDGAFNGGWNGKLNNGASLATANGSASELAQVTSAAEAQGTPLYLQVALTQIWKSGNGFRASRQALRGYDNTAVKLSRYQTVLGILNYQLSDGIAHDTWYLLSPRYLSAVTDNFLAEPGSYGSLAVTDLAGMYYADYRENNYITGEMGDSVLKENLEKLSDAKTLALSNPHIDKIGYGTVATDVSRESSDYATFEVTVPFKQLVMNGLIDYTTENVNLSSRNSAYFVLQAAELGSCPKFILTWKNVDVLKDTDFSYLYSAQYSLLEEKIKAVYEECEEIRSRIGTSEIAGHSVIEDGVYETVYANGTVVTVNYNLYDVTLPDGTALAAEGYLIKEGK